MSNITLVEPPWEVNTPRGKADVLALIDYSQESYIYFLTAQRDTGAFWIYRNDKCTLFWNESTGLGRKGAAEGNAAQESAQPTNKTAICSTEDGHLWEYHTDIGWVDKGHNYLNTGLPR